MKVGSSCRQKHWQVKPCLFNILHLRHFKCTYSINNVPIWLIMDCNRLLDTSPVSPNYLVIIVLINDNISSL